MVATRRTRLAFCRDRYCRPNLSFFTLLSTKQWPGLPVYQPSPHRTNNDCLHLQEYYTEPLGDTVLPRTKLYSFAFFLSLLHSVLRSWCLFFRPYCVRFLDLSCQFRFFSFWSTRMRTCACVTDDDRGGWCPLFVGDTLPPPCEKRYAAQFQHLSPLVVHSAFAARTWLIVASTWI